MSDADLIAAFMAQKGVTQVGEGVAYGVDKEADKAKRKAERERKSDNDLINERHVRGDVVYNGLGEYIGRV